MKKINVYLLRHGKAIGKPALNGQTDVLVEQEVQKEIAHRIMRHGITFSHIYSSHLHRCADLADYLVTHVENTSLKINSALSEMDFGMFDGREFSSLNESEWKILEQFWNNPASVELPKGEALSHFFHRCVRAWQTIVHELKEDTLIIAHGGTIRMILAYLLDIEWNNPRWITNLSIDNQSISHVQVMISDDEPHYLVKSIGVTL